MNLTVYTLLISFIVGVALMPLLIPSLIRLKFGQYVRSDGPESHQKKAGTPTMGGIMIIFSILASALVFMRDNPTAMAISLTTAAFGVVGFLDDYAKINKKQNMGLRAYQKLIGQLVVAIIFLLVWRTMPGYSTEILIPFFPDVTLDLGIFFLPFACLVFLSATNGANLTDGLDGLASGVTAIIAVFFMVAAWVLDSPAMPASGAVVGALLAFLVFNSHPARVMMGDTGSLALGGFVAAVSLSMQMPLFLFIVAIIYVIESLSVIIQVGYFKMTRKRFFKMAPIHHTFELSGWQETRIVAFFCIITALAAFLGIIALQRF